MPSTETLIFSRSDVERLLRLDECIAAVEDAFVQHAQGKTSPPGVLGMHAEDGGFHIKAALLTLDRPYFAAKTNGNFGQNGARHGLPTIQGVVVLCDAGNGFPLAVMDSISITALRTAAATAVAAKYLARKECELALVCGCGTQGAMQLRALCRVRKPRRIQAYDQDRAKAAEFAQALSAEVGIPVTVAKDLGIAVAASDIVITCTTSKRFFIAHDMVRAGTFIAAVGADNPEKQEIDPRLLAKNTVVADILEQCCEIGDLHHAIDAKVMTRADVHAELGQVAAGLKRARTSDDQIIIFDSSGTALQDVAAAAAVYRRAIESKQGIRFSFNA
ncbi:MAG TPA: ornithine cyclodeaminase family protein [Burkholderiales bacterium]|nr:ornithine cyclodeaminase family protein [Burkholderiales bacterium]